MSNPPYILDPDELPYRHGGGEHGAELSIRIVTRRWRACIRAAACCCTRASPSSTGRSGSSTRSGRCSTPPATAWRYEELDPDIFGGQLGCEGYEQRWSASRRRMAACAQGLVMVNLFLLPVLLARLVHLPACSPFRVAWWAASFPLAASAVTALRYAAVADSPAMDAIALLILGIATVVIGVFAVQTLAGIVQGRLRELS
jgi:hypothetical protein